ncbi:hypothetical protein EMPG_14705, partial [Blastomyces silverae]
ICKTERKEKDAKPLHASLKNLSINTHPTTKTKPSRKKSSPVAESWEDEPLSSPSSSDENEDGITPPASATLGSPITTTTTATTTTTSSSTGSSTPSSQLQTGTHAPPPTPISPQNSSLPRWV